MPPTYGQFLSLRTTLARFPFFIRFGWLQRGPQRRARRGHCARSGTARGRRPGQRGGLDRNSGVVPPAPRRRGLVDLVFDWRMVSRRPSSVVASVTSPPGKGGRFTAAQPPWNNTAARAASTSPRRRNLDDCAMKQILWAPTLFGGITGPSWAVNTEIPALVRAGDGSVRRHNGAFGCRCARSPCSSECSYWSRPTKKAKTR